MITLTFEPTNPAQAEMLGQFLPQYMRAGELVVSGTPADVGAAVEQAIAAEEKAVKKTRKAAATSTPEPAAVTSASAAASDTADEGNAVAAGQEAETAAAPAASSNGSSPSTSVTLEQVRAKLTALSQAGKAADVKKLISDFGAAKLTDIPADKYAELLNAAEGV